MDLQLCSHCHTAKPRDEWHPSQWGRNGKWCKICLRGYYIGKNNPTKVFRRDLSCVCTRCGDTYFPKSPGKSMFCTRSCKDKFRLEQQMQERRAAKESAAIRYCPHDGRPLPALMRADAKFCSARCNEAAHQLKRKLRNRGGASDKSTDGYIRAEIALRDGWRCGICHKKVDPGLRHPDPLCGSLDHIIPVSQGGTSDPVNLRLAHLVCNTSRRDRGGFEQLALLHLAVAS